jgi:adenosine deaminase
VKSLETHPLKFYFDLGLRVTVNTDNRLITDTSVSKELWLAHTKMGFAFEDIKRLILAGFKSSFQPFHERQAHLRRVAKELARYDSQGRVTTESITPSRHPAPAARRSQA